MIEIGTNHGASTLSICLALNVPLSNMTTVDLSHVAWKEAPGIQQDVEEVAAMNLSDVKFITQDFGSIHPEMVACSDERYFVFYDIHDHTAPFSEKFLNEWVPRFKNALVAIHDMSIVPNDYVLPQSETKRSKAVYNSVTYAGFAECERVINWAVNNNVTINPFHGGVSFEIRDRQLV